MPLARSTDFTEEFSLTDRKAIKEERMEPVEVLGEEIPPLDFNTMVYHLRRNGYDVKVSPNGGSLDAEGETGTKRIDLSSLKDDAVQIKYSIDIADIESRRDDPIDDPEKYLEKVYDQEIGELVEREKKLERASQNYVSSKFEAEDPVEKILSDFRKHGESCEEIVDSYFGDMRPSELGLNYAVHFELHQGETVENERRNLEGKMPLHYALEDEDTAERNRLYLERYLEKVLQKTGKRTELSDELKEYGKDIL